MYNNAFGYVYVLYQAVRVEFASAKRTRGQGTGRSIGRRLLVSAGGLGGGSDCNGSNKHETLSEWLSE